MISYPFPLSELRYTDFPSESGLRLHDVRVLHNANETNIGHFKRADGSLGYIHFLKQKDQMSNAHRFLNAALEILKLVSSL